MITWSEKFEIADTLVDNQHKRLIEIYNELHQSMEKGKSQAQLITIIGKLIDYTQYHFETEEDIMDEASYPYLLAHQKIHDSFIADVKKFQQRVVKEKELITLEILDFLKNWIENHILSEDMKFKPYL